MAKRKRVDRYYRGQGRCYLAPYGEENFLFLGNVSKLGIKIETETRNHKESVSGGGFRDKRLEVVTKAQLELVGDNFIKSTLAIALYGTEQLVMGTTVTGETYIAPEVGESLYVDQVQLDSLSVAGFTEGQDYAVNLDFGRVDILEGSAIAPEDELEISYSFPDLGLVSAFNTKNKNYHLVFEGFNNAEHETVTIDIFKARFNPISEWKLISDDFAVSELSGAAQVDSSREATGQGQVFSVRRVTDIPEPKFPIYCHNNAPTSLFDGGFLAIYCNNSNPTSLFDGGNILTYCNNSNPTSLFDGGNILTYCDNNNPTTLIDGGN